MDLDGAVAIVSGATGGIGGATALALAARGGRLVLTGRRTDRLADLGREVERRSGTAAVVVEGDLTSADTAQAVADAAMAAFGQVDLLVSSAGYGPPMVLADLSESVWDATIDSCLKAPYLMTRAVLPAMVAAGSGRILYVSSVAGKGAEARRTAYCAAKWGLQGFAMALQAELADTGVRVQVVNPASVATDWWATTDDAQPAPVLDRMMGADDVAESIVWMLTRADHIQVGELVLHNARSPWAADAS